ncbi:MAG: PEP/pyruvate-binding domain-containing protein [Myxococcota bacterium]
MMTLIAVLSACKSPEPTPVPTPPPDWACTFTEEEAAAEPDFARDIGCLGDFQALAAEPLDASIPGARSMKTVLDRADGNALYFQNSTLYQIHWEFASAFLSGNGLPIVQQLAQFNTVEYYSPDRRFVLGAITYYEEPAVWAYELSPYDTASAEMIELAYRGIQEHAYFGQELRFHPTSAQIETVAAQLPDDIQIVSTNELFAGITYQPLNIATSMGRLDFLTEEDLAVPPDFRSIVVLEVVPNDITATAGIITDQFQTPLSHINVLSQNRGTPNMGLRGAWENETLRALQGKWVELSVGPFEWTIREVPVEEADAWWEANRPEPIDVPPMDTSVTSLVDVHDLIDRVTHPDLREAITAAVPIYGGKASHYGAMSTIGDPVPVPPGFVIPVYHYDKHMADNGLWEVVDAMLADPAFRDDPAVRTQRLAELRAQIAFAPLDPVLEQDVIDQISNGGYVTTRFRFRSSTNAEDVSGFNGAGLYTSETGDPLDPTRPVRNAIRDTWASVWSDRAFAERSYYSIEHRNIGMALLCHRSFPEEESNGVAITGNVFDTAGVEPAFYINVQAGDYPVVRPEPGDTTDQILYYYTQPGQPIVYLAHSNLVPEGATVLTNPQVNRLGQALQGIHAYFAPAYGNLGGFYGMDVEFKFDQQFDDEPTLYIKQARPYPDWSR